ncbi:RNA polymerase subunit sigma [Streptomyces sp. NBC_01176]|uniref:RNA polymerase subunit sigma n=1 Tax=Streptomyces sp. NBC_01176 TaxID=2903760 RepID=UPI00386EE1BF|nr:RNA polymerase subunit sigma [Streptomyces sp. NBC_01176]
MDRVAAVPLAELLDERRYLLDVACWMLGSTGAAEGVVDETYRRWYGLPDATRGRIEVPRSWLAKTAGGICLGRLTGPGRVDDTDGTAGSADRLRTAERSTATLLVDRARHGVRVARPQPVTAYQHDVLARAVREACAAQDGELLASLLAPDATALFDGGGKVRALASPVHGCRQVAASLLTLLALRPRTTLTAHSVNGRTGLVARYDHQVAAVISLAVTDQRITRISIVLNPDKLRLWNRPPSSRGAPERPSPRSDGRL